MQIYYGMLYVILMKVKFWDLCRQVFQWRPADCELDSFPAKRDSVAGGAVGYLSFSDQGRRRLMLKNKGLLRVYTEQGSGSFLGAVMVSPVPDLEIR